MDTWWRVLLEILKYTIPGLVVFATAFFILKKHLDTQLRIRAMELKSEKTNKTLSLKMQAYERLALFCERISIPNLVLRLRTEELTANQFRQSLILAVQQEYEHNFSQQIYVSEKLWQIVSITKNQIVEIVNLSEDAINSSTSTAEYIQMMLNTMKNLSNDPTRMAIEAIKKEVKLYI